MSDNCSETSASRLDGSGDLQSKYSRLAAEYSKIRSQNTVLKKAVVDEQARYNELTNTLREHEQIIRKSNQEMESLNFRNLQMSRRVVVLQEELNNAQNTAKPLKKSKAKNKHDIPNGAASSDNLDEELKKMIMENAKLISSMQDKEMQSERDMLILKEEVQRLNSELQICNLKLKQANDDNKVLIEEFKNENKELKRDNVLKLSKLKTVESDLNTLKKTYSTYVNDTIPKLKIQQQIISQHLPFIDDSDVCLNQLNVRASLPVQRTTVTLPSHIKSNLEAAVTSLSSIIKCIGLESSVPKLPEIFSTIETLVERDCVQLFHEIKNCIDHIKNASEKLDVDSEEQNIEKVVCQFLNRCLDVVLSFYISYLKKIDQLPEEITSINELPLLSQIHLFQTSKEEFHKKCIEAPSLPRDVLSEHFKELNNYIDKLLAEITEKANEFLEKESEPESSLVNRFKSRAARYMFSLKKGDVERISYIKALKNQKELRECLMLHSSFKEELSNLKEALTIAEQEKVYWMNEYRLLEKKSDNLPVVVKELETENSSEITNELGSLTSSLIIPAEILQREKEVKKYLNGKINSAIAEKQEAYSKARTFMFESKLLQKRLENCIIDREMIEKKLVETGKTVLELQEELSTVTQNYELQLRMMSEHLANINDKLTIQTDTIEQLNYKLHHKGNKSTFYVTALKKN